MPNFIQADQIQEILTTTDDDHREIARLILSALNRVADGDANGCESAIWRLIDAATLCARKIGCERAEKTAGIREATGLGGKLTITHRPVTKIAYVLCDRCDRRFGVGTTHCSFCY